MRMMVKRQHLLLAGLLLFFAGVQFRVVESFTLSEKSTRFIATQLGAQPAAPATAAGIWQAPTGRKILAPPRWLGLALMSAGSVLTLRSLSMRGGD
ncbi:MAG: hypothetical protein ACKO9B_18075 [Planctomycetota bacterium]|nr:hypothetical protein [Planctomycetota bacterium]MBM4057597.1 hypothetical protein [Planctomycetota bacterium]